MAAISQAPRGLHRTAPRRTTRSAALVTVRAALVTSSSSSTATPPPPQRAPREPQQRVLPLLASAVEANASLYGYERLAGRSAMVGLAAACVFEVAGGGGVLSSPPDLPSGLLSAVAMAVLGASAAAVASTARSPAALGARWREPVVASLTAVRRANAGVTPSWRLRGLDRAVDDVLGGLKALEDDADGATEDERRA